MKDGFPKELIQHIVEGIQMYAKHNGYTKLDYSGSVVKTKI